MRKEHYNLHACVEDTHWWFVARRRIIRGIACCVLDPGKQQTVVDIGCGTGANIAAFHPDFACTGIDTAPEAIRTASGRFPEVKFVCGSIADGLPNGAELADLFLCTDVLEHVYDDFGFMSSLVAAARPGSHILITVPAFMQLWSPHDESFGHYRRYDFDRLKKTWAGLPVTVRLHPGRCLTCRPESRRMTAA